MVIAMIGNPFSPWYARARRQDNDSADPFAHAALNVALYGPGGRRVWSLTERTADRGARSSDGMRLGESEISVSADRIAIDVREQKLFGGSVRGRIELTRESEGLSPWALDADGKHAWWLVMPRGRLSVTLQEPNVQFTGHGYHDANAGAAALDESFRHWSWARGHGEGGRTIVTYDVTNRDAGRRTLFLEVARDGTSRSLGPVRKRALPTTLWGLRREAVGDREHGFRVERSLEDTPFYARAMIAGTLAGEPMRLMHEQLSLDRFRKRWVQFLLGYRMSRERTRSAPQLTRGAFT